MTIEALKGEQIFIQGKGNIPNERFLFVNGMITSQEKARSEADLLSWVHGDVNVYCAYDSTKGLCRDLIEAAQLTAGYQTEGSERVALAVKYLLGQMEAETPGEEHTLHIIGHSKGGLTVERMLDLLEPEEKQQLDIKLVGSPAVIAPDTVKSVLSYRATLDYIHHLGIEPDGDMPVKMVPTLGETWMDKLMNTHKWFYPTFMSGFLQKEGDAFLSAHPAPSLPMDQHA